MNLVNPVRQTWPRHSPSSRALVANVAAKGSRVLLEPRPIKPEKTVASPLPVSSTRIGSPLLLYPGFKWEASNGTVSLTETERLECLELVKRSLGSGRQLSDKRIGLPYIVQRLSRVSHVIIAGRSHLKPLIAGALSEAQEGAPLQPQPSNLEAEMKKELRWWKKFLRRPNELIQASTLAVGKVKNKVYTDASRRGCGVMIDDESKSWRWKPGFKPEVMWAEAIAVELAVRRLVSQRRSHSEILCDNEGVVRSWNRGGSTNPMVNKVILSILQVLVQNGCWLTMSWISSRQNLADKPSRSLDKTRQMVWDPSIIPLEIQAYFQNI